MFFGYLFLSIFLLPLLSSDSLIKPTKMAKTICKKSYAMLTFSNRINFKNDDMAESPTCNWLRGCKRLKRLCWKQRNLNLVMWSARKLAVNHCEEDFRYDQWNCSFKSKFFKSIYRETAYMQSLSAAALLYTVAKDCAAGRIPGCHCGDQGTTKSNDSQWGGCADNIKYGKKLTKRFLQHRRRGDALQEASNYNIRRGIKAVLGNMETKCRCHGLSSSCTMKTCWRRIRPPFRTISQQLKNEYHRAISVEFNNSNIRLFVGDKDPQQLIYFTNSPNFCPSTVGRRCLHVENCATLCCGRGFYDTTESVIYPCNFKLDQTYKLSYRNCTRLETKYLCK